MVCSNSFATCGSSVQQTNQGTQRCLKHDLSAHVFYAFTWMPTFKTYCLVPICLITDLCKLLLPLVSNIYCLTKWVSSTFLVYIIVFFNHMYISQTTWSNLWQYSRDRIFYSQASECKRREIHRHKWFAHYTQNMPLLHNISMYIIDSYIKHKQNMTFYLLLF